jgi:flagellar assembly protein FliH
MMSSSRIIKGAAQEAQPFAGFSFEELQEESLPLLPCTAGEFQPLFTINPVPAKESAKSETSGQPAEGGLSGDSPGPGEEELQRLLQDACDRGFADGRREAEESFAGICRTLSEAIGAVSGLRERLVRECEDDLLRLAMMVSKQIIRQEISQDRQILARFVSEATTGITDQNDIVICFHPEDYQLVSANRQLYLAGIGDKMKITIKPDDSVSVGGCVIETKTGLVDARVETQLAEIYKRLLQERGHGSDESLGLPAEAELYLAEQCGAEKYVYQQD